MWGLYNKAFNGNNKFHNVRVIVNNLLYTITNTLSFHVTELIAAEKSFMMSMFHKINSFIRV
jgi:hypothetical protein